MYKVVNISDLNIANNFIESDKVIDIDANRTKMKIANNDYAHKSKSYLSDCINVVDSALNSYLDAITEVTTTYLTSDLHDVYIRNGNAIKTKTLERIISSDAFLTKDGCKALETKCLAYIDELKNKAVSIMMAQLNKSFIAQNSAGKLAYGQKSDKDPYYTDYTIDVTEDGLPIKHNYNFETGEFSFGHLLFGQQVEPWGGNDGFEEDPNVSPPSNFIKSKSFPDAWSKVYDSRVGTWKLDKELSDYLENEISSYVLLNSNGKKGDFKITVPEASFDLLKNQSIPIATLVEVFLKRQIKTVIKNVCDKYISKMSSIPEFIVDRVIEPN